MRNMMESSHTPKHFQISENTFWAFSIWKMNTQQHIGNMEWIPKYDYVENYHSPSFYMKKSQAIVLIILRIYSASDLANALNLSLRNCSLIIKPVLY